MSLKLKRRPAYSVIAFWTLVSSAILGGCSPPAQIQASSHDSEPVHSIQVRFPAEPEKSPLCLVGEDDNLRLGSTVEQAFTVFPKPSRAFEFSGAPRSLDDSFRGRGWEHVSESFGVITTGGRVAVALLTYASVDEERLSDIVRTYTELLERRVARAARSNTGQIGSVDGFLKAWRWEGPEGDNLVTAQVVAGSKIRYWFWEWGNQRLMIATAFMKEGRMDVSVALGHKSVMDVLRMGQEAARVDQVEAERLLAGESAT